VGADLEALTGASPLVRSHAEDLELAQRCASGDSDAWDRFVLEYRPVLYRAADALDRHGSAREVADALYAELYGMKNAEGQRQSLFRYFHGRSSLATWLRAVLAQRYVDRLRAQRRLEPIADGGDGDEPRGVRPGLAARAAEPDPSRNRYLTLLRQALAVAVGALAPKERLRLSCYYAQELTLAETGRIVQEHEATVSRQLARTRRGIRTAVEQWLASAGLTPAQVADCLASVAADPGPIDLQPILGDSTPAEQVRERSL
jgi:RNA polymerase sigma factor (sigma-70 family)